MKKIVIILFLAFTAILEIQAQGAMVVQDPLNAQINTTIQVLNEKANALNSFVANSKLLELSSDALGSIKSIEEIAKLVDDLACMTADFNYYLNISNNYNCASFLSFRLVSINLNYATDILSSVVLAKNIFTMSSASRLDNLNTIKEVLQNTIKDMSSIVQSIRSSIRSAQYRELVNKSYQKRFAKTASFTRKRR